ncbi:MAG: helix-turn-helix transcriptional regulator [Anaerolineae bacterium]|nr:helix-turn-helix transcriptional regulator [Anaerolineae bacterium]
MLLTPNEVIFIVRRLKGLYQEDVARLAGLSRPTLISIEKGRRPEPEQLKRIEAALGVSVTDPRITRPLSELKEALQLN